MRGGYTLLEVTLAIAVLSLLIAGAFALASGSMELTEDVAEFEERQVLRMRFLSLCETTFSEIPWHAQLRLDGDSEDSKMGQTLFLSDHPAAFPMGVVRVAGRVPEGDWRRAGSVLTLHPDGAGTWQVRLHSLNQREVTQMQANPRALLVPETAEPLTLVSGVKQCSWRFFDPERERWRQEWPPDGKRPRFVELQFQLVGEPAATRSVFWIPPLEKPSLGTPLPDEESPLDSGETGDGAEEGVDEAAEPEAVGIGGSQTA
ncbi:MAG: prepilin-type N-terminal cleavage/methylation domain-containing protein [Verrucomicrobiota bacterium]